MVVRSVLERVREHARVPSTIRQELWKKSKNGAAGAPLPTRLEQLAKVHVLHPEHLREGWAGGLEGMGGGFAHTHAGQSWLSREEIRDVYAAADVFVLATRGEGWFVTDSCAPSLPASHPEPPTHARAHTHTHTHTHTGALRDTATGRAGQVVRLTRARGRGLPVVEAMAMQLPVIVTNFSGPTAYLTPANSYPLEFHLPGRALGAGGRGSQWASPQRGMAEPSRDHLVEVLSHVFQHRNEARSKGEQARRDVVARLSPGLRSLCSAVRWVCWPAHASVCVSVVNIGVVRCISGPGTRSSTRLTSQADGPLVVGGVSASCPHTVCVLLTRKSSSDQTWWPRTCSTVFASTSPCPKLQRQGHKVGHVARASYDICRQV